MSNKGLIDSNFIIKTNDIGLNIIFATRNFENLDITK